MSLLFESSKIGNLEIKNRLICSATYEGTAAQTGEISEAIIKRYRNLARGEVGLMITGYMYVDPLGRAVKRQTGIHTDKMTPGLKTLADTVHHENGRIIFQIAHAGRQTNKAVTGQTPLGPSSTGRDPVHFFQPKQMTEAQIHDTVLAFRNAARRAAEAGADGIQLHAAHGYLINQFLSPFFNDRNDDWGGSDEKRFRFLKELVIETKKELPDHMLLMVKLNTHDHTPQKGITPELAKKYARWLGELGIDALEVSCGSPIYSFMNMCRGDVPVKELVAGLPWWQKPIGKLMLSRMAGKYDLVEGYNLDAAKQIKPVMNDIPLILVGGLRRVSQMEQILTRGHADFISMSRPFIREPFLVKKIKKDNMKSVSCISCNKCFAAVAGNQPLRCFYTASEK